MIFRNKKQPQHFRSRLGFTMLEVVVAMAVGAVGVMAFIGLQLKAVEISNESRNRANAVYIASEMAERMMSNTQDFEAQRIYRGEAGSSWEAAPPTITGGFMLNNHCALASDCLLAEDAAERDIAQVKELAASMLPNGDISHRTCGDNDTFDCLVVTWGDAQAGTCNPVEDSCYILQMKIW